MVMSESRLHSRSEPWQLEGIQARLSAGCLTAVLDVTRPFCGLINLHIDGDPVVGRLLSVGVEPAAVTGAASEAPWQAADAYVRGCDLVATYREPLGHPFNVQVYWRVVDDQRQQPPELETIVSIQTPRWEAYPCVTVESMLANGELVWADDTPMFRFAANWSYAEIAPPGDFALTVVEPTVERVRGFQWRFGPQFMEKGVIRRLRIRSAIVPRQGDEVAARSLRAGLLAEQPPLTA